MLPRAIIGILPAVLEINVRAAVVTEVLKCTIVVVVCAGVLATVVVSVLESPAPDLYPVYLLAGSVADVNVNVFIVAVSALEFTLSISSEEFSC